MRQSAMCRFATTISLVAPLLIPGRALADPVTVLKLAIGQGGPLAAGGGAGNEHPDVALLTSQDKLYAVVVNMSSHVKEGPWQCKCSSIMVDPVIGPVVVVDQTLLTNNGGSRPCNHPRIASNGGNYAVWAYSSNEANSTTRTYVQGINHLCELVTDRLRISEIDTQNEGAPDLRFEGEDRFVAGYLSTANTDQDATYAALIRAKPGMSSPEKAWGLKVVAPANIGRPQIASIRPERAILCASQGNNRPPEEGVACALLDTTKGEILDKQVIAQSDPAAGIYLSQPSVARLSKDMVAVQVQESNGVSQQNTAHLFVLDVSGDTLLQVASIDGVGPNPVHSSICAGAFGPSGEPHIAVMGAPRGGAGDTTLAMVRFAPSGLSFDPATGLVKLAPYGDSGYLPNLYGGGNGLQGREYLRCVGDVKNPGFAQTGGYAPEVETFFVAPFTAKEDIEDKNALFVAFTAGKSAPPSSTTSTSSGGGGGGQGGASSSGTGGEPDLSVVGCACRTGQYTNEAGLGAMFLLGLASLLRRIRRSPR